MTDSDDLQGELRKLEEEEAALREKRKALQERARSGVAAAEGQSGGVSVSGSLSAGGDVVGRDKIEQQTVVIAQDSTIVIGDQPIAMTAVRRETDLGRYLSHIISRNRYLQLQGIRSGGKLVNIELEHIYITLHATRTIERRDVPAERNALPEGDVPTGHLHEFSETITVKVEEALAGDLRMVVLGDPGSGKTTLLRYLALCYARDRAERSTVVRDRLGLQESGHLPILLPLRNLGAYLQEHYPRDDGTEGHDRLLNFLREYLKGERIALADNFFDADLDAGRVLVLLDGMDEVANADLRRRVARLIDAFAAAYPKCRMVVTSRIVGYSGPARLGENFLVTTVRDFTLADVEQFLRYWHRLVAVGQMGSGESAEAYAASQTAQLLNAIQANRRVRELAVNPLMLTVIALVHRDRVKLPDRRAELYAEAVDVLLGKWDEARGVDEAPILDERPFDAGDRRLLLQAVALRMHEARKKEIDADDLRGQLQAAFANVTTDARAAARAADRFLTVIQERTGLLVEAGQGVYRFSHLTFQEYLAAVEIAERDDYVEYTLRHAADTWWRETILLEAGYLSAKKAAKVTRLIKAIADNPVEAELFGNLALAAECLRDVGPTRVEGDLAKTVRGKLTAELGRPLPDVPGGGLAGIWGALTRAEEKRGSLVARRLAAIVALGKIESGALGAGGEFWSPPHGEPDWVTIPAGEFWMGSDESEDERPVHRVFLPEYQIARVPVTNAQYQLFAQATGAKPPRHWIDGQPPKNKANHPVVYVAWHDARAYCEWLSKVTGKSIRLPSEAEWEKAARGDKDKRVYPWSDEFDLTKCNSWELGLRDTSPVGVFLAGASPYGCLDMSGNVLEWTSSKWKKYPYEVSDGREDLKGNEARVLRGGSWYHLHGNCRSAFRLGFEPSNFGSLIGFRVALSPGEHLES